MSWYMYEPRSKIYDYDENNDDHKSFWGLSDILLLPLIVIGMFCLELSFVVGLFIYYLSDVHKTTKETLKTGDISYPFLAQVGIPLMVILFCVFLHPPAGMENNLILFKIIASLFVFNHTILPYSAVFIYKLQGLFGAKAARKPDVGSPSDQDEEI